MIHPYVAYESTSNWKALNEAIDELVANSDLIEKTNRAYIVGFLCKALDEENPA
jgi:hypothetical protein